MPTNVTSPGRRTSLALMTLLAVAFLMRAAYPGQQIVENYVGRQTPTAMVARNLERGSGFLRPQIDVLPRPNLFLVEPPVYAAAVVGLRRLARQDLAPAGRLVSAMGVVLGAWGLFGLVARREGETAGLVAVAVFIALPVTVRYGRAFQPDALMLGGLVAGLRGWDEFEHGGGRGWLFLGVVATSAALALKVISAYALVPLVFIILRPRTPWKIALAATTLVPAALWYVHAAGLIAAGSGSRASADNGAVWLAVLRPDALARAETYRNLARFFLVRAFTPLGPPLAVLGLVAFRRPGDGLWRVWGGSALGALAVLAAKLHHEYYWLALAPAVAVGVGRTLTVLGACGPRGRALVAATATGFFGLCAVFSAGTWRTPADWRTLPDAAAAVRECVPPDALVVAPDALLFAADRRGCRLEISPGSARRAAGEWGDATGRDRVDGAPALVEFYRARGARYFADVVPPGIGPVRLALHRAVRARYNLVIDRPGVLLADLSAPRDAPAPSEEPRHGTGRPAEAGPEPAPENRGTRGHDPGLRPLEAPGA